ncbi:MAG: zinc-binding dehydrogenase [Caldilineaceae bacterium]
MTNRKMVGAVLPGNSTVEFQEFAVPQPGHGQVLIQCKASTICGSDIRAIYHEHLGKGPEGYQGVIAGHEPSGQIVAVGPGLKRFKTGDRVIIYHISGCGVCYDCRRGYMISCTSEHRAAYGWQRHGGMAPYILADEKDLVLLPDQLSYLDGAQVACGFGTVYEGLERIGINGNDAVLVMGLGPVGLAALMLAKAMGAQKLIGVDLVDERLRTGARSGIGRSRPQGRPRQRRPDPRAHGRSWRGAGRGRQRQRQGPPHRHPGHTQVGQNRLHRRGGTVNFQPSPDIIHDQKTIYGSWVTSIWKMEELVERLVRWGIHPEDLVTHRFSLEHADEAYRLMADGRCGKVAVVFE